MASTPSKNDVAALFNSPDAADLGISGKGSDILIANLNATTLPMCVGAPIDSLESDDVTIIMFCIDASPSMEKVADLLIETFNEIMIDGLKGAAKKTANSIVIGGLSFSTKITPMWGGGFIKLQDLPRLTKQDYDPSKGNATNLFKGQLDSLTAAGAYATQVLAETGTPPKVIVVGMSDGADNCRMVNPQDVLIMTQGLSRELWKLPMAIFETYERVDGRQIAQDTGFDVFEFKKGPNETDDDIRRRFRHMIGTVSSSVISASQAKVGTPAASQTFWQPGT
jgi:hypothetical protein